MLYKMHVVLNPDKLCLLPCRILIEYLDCVRHGLTMCAKASKNIRLFYKSTRKEVFYSKEMVISGKLIGTRFYYISFASSNKSDHKHITRRTQEEIAFRNRCNKAKV